MIEKIRLSGEPDKTVTWIWLEDGGLKVEYYDFSELVQNMFGNDIAYTLTVARNEMENLYSLAKQDTNSVLEWALQTFRSYFEIKHWLDENKIEYTKDIESWA